jgi:hypothetical protein
LATVRVGRRFPNIETYRQRKDGTLVDVMYRYADVAAGVEVRDAG